MFCNSSVDAVSKIVSVSAVEVLCQCSCYILAVYASGSAVEGFLSYFSTVIERLKPANDSVIAVLMVCFLTAVFLLMLYCTTVEAYKLQCYGSAVCVFMLSCSN
jgi:hypothetical protein